MKCRILPELAKVATSGDYLDLKNIPKGVGDAETLEGKHASDFAPVAHSHKKAEITDFPVLADIAVSGDYNDLRNKPSSLPANGGNADMLNGKHDTDFATAEHTHTKTHIIDFAHTHTPQEAGAAPARHTHTKEDLPAFSDVALTGDYHDLKNTPAALPANGGNAETVGGKRGEEIATIDQLFSEGEFHPYIVAWDAIPDPENLAVNFPFLVAMFPTLTAIPLRVEIQPWSKTFEASNITDVWLERSGNLFYEKRAAGQEDSLPRYSDKLHLCRIAAGAEKVTEIYARGTRYAVKAQETKVPFTIDLFKDRYIIPEASHTWSAADQKRGDVVLTSTGDLWRVVTSGMLDNKEPEVQVDAEVKSGTAVLRYAGCQGYEGAWRQSPATGIEWRSGSMACGLMAAKFPIEAGQYIRTAIKHCIRLWVAGKAYQVGMKVAGPNTKGRVWECRHAGIAGDTAVFSENAVLGDTCQDHDILWKCVGEYHGTAQWFWKDSSPDFRTTRDESAHDSYAARLVWAIDQYLSATNDSKWLGFPSPHEEYTYGQVIKEIIQQNLTSQLDRGLTKAFQNDQHPSGEEYAARYLMNNCESYAGLVSAINIFSNYLKDKAYADTLLPIKDELLAVLGTIYDEYEGCYKYEVNAEMDENLKPAPFHPWIMTQLWPALWSVPLDAKDYARAVRWANEQFPEWWSRNDIANAPSLGAHLGYAYYVNSVSVLLDILKRVEEHHLFYASPVMTVSDAACFFSLADLALKKGGDGGRGKLPDIIQESQGAVDEGKIAALNSQGKLSYSLLPATLAYYENIGYMKADITLKAGLRVKTLGRETVHDGGGALYRIAGTDEGKAWAIRLDNSLFALIDNRDFVSYKMFGAALDGTTDDEIAISQAHTYANANHVRVEQHGGIIYKGSQNAISVMTDVDLSGSTIKMTDANNSRWYVVGDSRDVYYAYPVSAEQKAQLLEGSSYFEMIDNSLPANTVIKLTEDPYCVRDNYGELYSVPREELLVHDMHGICTGPLTAEWSNAGGNPVVVNGETVTSTFVFTYTFIPEKRLTFIGCDVSIETSNDVYLNLLNVNRHNTLIKDFTIRPHRNSLRNSVFKNAIFYIWDSYNVDIQNVNGFNTAGRDTNWQTKGTSGYFLRMRNCMGVRVHGCRINGYWGATAMECVKDIHFTACEINRIDVHHYFSNLFIDRVIFHNIGVQIGSGNGLVTITNCTFHYQNVSSMTHGNNMIELNNTFGRPFTGTIIAENIHIVSHQSVHAFSLVYGLFHQNPVPPKVFDFKLPELRFRNITAKIIGGRALYYMHFEGAYHEELHMFKLASFQQITTNVDIVWAAVFEENTGLTTSFTGSEAKISLLNCPPTDTTTQNWFGKASNPSPTVSILG
ncbi:hypothetical protein [Pelosinus fermentans]|uniref:Uncharacterized protein n=1 Tax=Pelosinus fermentans JBW45 TaxID=1192197 RepID=I8TNV5_9FIRM|nr:hypothetical protein [Pelosinus fermentans]AJQ29004.1 hypothetical protein JBW_03667 [Pelosinus fermentans JBW45]